MRAFTTSFGNAIFSDMQGKFSVDIVCGAAAKNGRPLTGNNHMNYQSQTGPIRFAHVLFAEQ